MALLGHPDWAMMTDSQGNRVTKPYVSGPSPISQGLMAAGFGMMGDGASEWVGGGGFNWDALGRGGLLGLQAYQNANKNLQDQRSEFYTQRNALEDQLIQNQRFKNEQEELERLKQVRENRDKSFPELLQLLRNSGRQEYIDAVPMLQQLYATSPEKAVAASMNIVSQLKTAPGTVETKPILDDKDNPTGHILITQNGDYKGTVKTGGSGSGVFPDKLDKKTYDGLLFKANQPDSTISPDNYMQLYKGRQRLDATYKDFTSLDKKTSKRYYPALHGVVSPWDKFLNHPNPELRLTEEEMKAKGWKPDPSLSVTIGESTKPIPVTAQQSAYKVAGIVGSEDDMSVLSDKGYDVTKMDPKNILTYLAGKWEINPLSGPVYEDARAYESHALKGAMAFAYLFSGATVRAEEMTQFRKTMYPMPGDNPSLVASKRKSRERIIKLYNSMNPSSIKMAYALAKKANGGNLPPLDLQHVETPLEEIPDATNSGGISAEELDKIADKIIEEEEGG